LGYPIPQLCPSETPVLLVSLFHNLKPCHPLPLLWWIPALSYGYVLVTSGKTSALYQWGSTFPLLEL